ncbi:MAG: sugar phosphate isomerase/epimerase [Clostridia bacterium]|nr:sugar phosphate isomerase/epimerase [Clostridia bacterium]
MKLGLLVSLTATPDIAEKLKSVHDLGFTSCQITCWDMSLYTDEMAARIRDALDTYGITVSTLWCGWSGRKKWNFYDGQLTLGLVPEAYRAQRIEELKRGSDFAKKLGVAQIATHAGFLPENPYSEQYHGVICALREVAEHVKKNGQLFLFETGQETPTTLLRAIEDVGTDNLGINLDPANFILYGKANPVDALDTLGAFVRDVHAKDGLYPTNGRELGRETPLGEGKVNIPALIVKLKSLGYDGPITIEREISGEQQIADIKAGKLLLEQYI